MALAALGLGACVSAPAPADRPAVLEASWVETAKAAVATALGRAEVEFGAPDPTRAPVVIVLPPRPGPYETNSPALPLRYDLRIAPSGCILVPQDAGEPALVLKRSACHPFALLGEE